MRVWKPVLEPATQRVLDAAWGHSPAGCTGVEPLHVLLAFFDGGPLPPALGHTFRSASVRRAMRAGRGGVRDSTPVPTVSSVYRGNTIPSTIPSRAVGAAASPPGEATARVLARAASLANRMLAGISPNHLALAIVEDVGVREATRSALDWLELETTARNGAMDEETFRGMLTHRWLSEALASIGVRADELEVRPRAYRDASRRSCQRSTGPAVLDDDLLIRAIMKNETAGSWLASLGVQQHALMMRLTHERTVTELGPALAPSEREEVVLFDDPYTEGGVFVAVLEQVFGAEKAEAVRHVLQLVEDGCTVLRPLPTRLARQRVHRARAVAASRNAPMRIELRSVLSV